MGFGGYSESARSVRAESLGFMHQETSEIFSKHMKDSMNPHGVEVRESRDSEEHPNSVPIIIALDVTGSMGSIPHHLVKTGLPKIVTTIINAGIPDPQILFLAIGDHECDRAPLQVGQFESSDELLDKWLTDVYLEGGGGANEGESYLLAWYFAAFHTAIDSWEKRGQKGFLFTIGDEPTLPRLSSQAIGKIMGKDGNQSYSAHELVEAALGKWECYHLHIQETMAGRLQHVMDDWKQLMQNNLIILESKNQVPTEIAKLVIGENRNDRENSTNSNNKAF